MSLFGQDEDHEYISIKNFNPDPQNFIKIDSPKSLKAITNLGYQQSELLQRQLKDFEEEAQGIKLPQNVDPSVYQQERFQQYEMKRQEKIRLISQERNKLIKQDEKENEFRSKYSQSLQLNSGSKAHNVSLTQESFMERGSKELWHIKSKNQKDIEFLYDKQMLREDIEYKQMQGDRRLKEIELNQQIKQNQKQIIDKEREKSRQQKQSNDTHIKLVVAKQIIAEQEKDEARVKSLSKEKFKKQQETKQVHEIKRQQAFVDKLEIDYNQQRCKTENYNRKSKQEFKQVMEKKRQIEQDRQQKQQQASEERQKIESKIQQLQTEKKMYLMMLDDQIVEKDRTSTKRKASIDNKRNTQIQEKRANSELRQAVIYTSVNNRHESIKKRRQKEIASKSKEAEKRLEKIEFQEDERVRIMQEEMERRQGMAQHKSQQLHQIKIDKRKQEHDNLLMKEQQAEQVRQQIIQQDIMKLQIQQQLKQESARENIDRIQRLHRKKLHTIREKISMDDEKYKQLLNEKEELQRVKEGLQRSIDKQKEASFYQYKKALRAFRRKDTFGLEKSLQENSISYNNRTSYERFDDDLPPNSLNDYSTCRTTMNGSETQGFHKFNNLQSSRSKSGGGVGHTKEMIPTTNFPSTTTAHQKNHTIGFPAASNQHLGEQNQQNTPFPNRNQNNFNNQTQPNNIAVQSQNTSPYPDKFRLNPIQNESLTVKTRFNKNFKSHQVTPREITPNSSDNKSQQQYFVSKNKKPVDHKSKSPNQQSNILQSTPKVSILQSRTGGSRAIESDSNVIKLDKIKQFEGYLNQSNQNTINTREGEDRNHKSIKTETTIEVGENDINNPLLTNKSNAQNKRQYVNNRYQNADDQSSRIRRHSIQNSEYDNIVMQHYTIDKSQNINYNNSIEKSSKNNNVESSQHKQQQQQQIIEQERVPDSKQKSRGQTQMDQQNRNLLNPERVDEEPSIKSSNSGISPATASHKENVKKQKPEQQAKRENVEMQFQETQFSQHFVNSRVQTGNNEQQKDTQGHNIKQSQNSLNLLPENNIPQYVTLGEQNSPGKSDIKLKGSQRSRERPLAQNKHQKKEKSIENDNQDKMNQSSKPQNTSSKYFKQKQQKSESPNKK